MKLSDVIEFVEYFMNFRLFEINKTAVTASSILMFLVFIALFAVTSRLLQRVLRAHVFSHMKIDAGIQYTLTRMIHFRSRTCACARAFRTGSEWGRYSAVGLMTGFARD